MRLGIVTHVVRENDGQGRVNLEVIREAVRQGWSITIFSTELLQELRDEPKVTWVKIGYGPFPSNLLRYQFFALSSFLEVARRRSEIDILNVNGFITWGSSDINAVHYVHNGWLNSGYFPYSAFSGAMGFYQVVYTRMNVLLERYALRRARTIVAVSNQVAGELKSAGVGGPVDVIDNGVALERFAEVTRNRAAFSLPEDKFLLLFVGDTKSPRKNLESVIRALPRLPDRISLVVGGVIDGSPAPRLAQELGVVHRVHFLGHVTAIPELMASTDIFVFPSRYDPFGLVIPEAMAAGLPVVTSACVGASGLLQGAGILLDDPDSIDELEQAVLAIYSNEALRESMQQLARSGAAHNSWTVMARKYVALYERTFQEKRSGVPAPKR